MKKSNSDSIIHIVKDNFEKNVSVNFEKELDEAFQNVRKKL